MNNETSRKKPKEKPNGKKTKIIIQPDYNSIITIYNSLTS